MTPSSSIRYEWRTEERRCTCTTEHLRWRHRRGGSGVVKLARLRPVADDASEKLSIDNCITYM